MKLLLDTNVFLWYITGDQSLPQKIINQISDENSQLHLSIISVWEIVVKQTIGKIELEFDLFDFIGTNEKNKNLKVLGLQKSHIQKVKTLPLIHRDPFDRIILAQALDEKMEFLYTDHIFDEYLQTL